MKRTAIICVVSLAAVMLEGCDVRICRYESEGIVEMPESKPSMAVAAFPWPVVVTFLEKVLPYAGQTRRKAMEERVNYQERRSFTLFSGTSAEPEEEK